MKLTTKGRYAVQAMADIAAFGAAGAVSVTEGRTGAAARRAESASTRALASHDINVTLPLDDPV